MARAKAWEFLQPIEPGVLNAAFVSGPTRTVWLSAIHSPVTVKPDTKMLSGLNLRDALDPLGDQTYHFTAARSGVAELGFPVGVSPRGSKVWLGPTTRWSEFVSSSTALLRHLSLVTKPELQPLPVIATESEEAPPLEEAFEFHFVPPELLADSPDVEPESKVMMERWAYYADFEITTISDQSIHADVTLEGSPLASIVIELDTSNPSRVKIVNVDITPSDSASQEDIKELDDVCRKLSWFKVWYESGHTIANGAVFEIRHRDEPFNDFKWVDLTGYNAKKEKFWTGAFPEDAAEKIGTDDSLFSWVKNNWSNPGDSITAASGWLACDDRSMEMADFIHLDDTSEPPVLSLIHVKGANSKEATRGISVSAHEIVVGQAIKNLRYLDQANISEGLRAGLEHKIGKLVWHNRQLSTRDEMLNALSKIGASYERLIVVLQPHVTKSKLQEVRGKTSHRDYGRIRQLDTLLHGAQAACRDLGAKFMVVSEAI